MARAAGLELGIAALALLCGVGVWGITNTPLFADNRPLADLINFCVGLGVWLIAGKALIRVPGQMAKDLSNTKADNGNGENDE